jgi:hypothetical protein
MPCKHSSKHAEPNPNHGHYSLASSRAGIAGSTFQASSADAKGVEDIERDENHYLAIVTKNTSILRHD